MATTTVERPRFVGFHHYASTVTDLGRSAAWYERVLGLTRRDHAGPDADGADVVLLADPESGIAIRLRDTGAAEPGGYLGFAVSSRSQLDTWASWLDGLGVAHSGVSDVGDPPRCAYLVFRDPDDVPLVLVHMAG